MTLSDVIPDIIFDIGTLRDIVNNYFAVRLPPVFAWTISRGFRTSFRHQFSANICTFARFHAALHTRGYHHEWSLNTLIAGLSVFVESALRRTKHDVKFAHTGLVRGDCILCFMKGIASNLRNSSSLRYRVSEAVDHTHSRSHVLPRVLR